MHQFDIFGKKEGGLKNASRVLDKGGDAKTLNLGQKPRKSRYKPSEFILYVHAKGEMQSGPFQNLPTLSIKTLHNFNSNYFSVSILLICNKFLEKYFY